MTSNALRRELMRLSRAERLELVEELWDSIATDPASEPGTLDAARSRELDRRLRALDEDPDRAIPWGEVRDRLARRTHE